MRRAACGGGWVSVWKVPPSQVQLRVQCGESSGEEGWWRPEGRIGLCFYQDWLFSHCRLLTPESCTLWRGLAPWIFLWTSNKTKKLVDFQIHIYFPCLLEYFIYHWSYLTKFSIYNILFFVHTFKKHNEIYIPENNVRHIFSIISNSELKLHQIQSLSILYHYTYLCNACCLLRDLKMKLLSGNSPCIFYSH